MKKLKIGIALGGGGARGLAHLGVLKVFRREGIVPDLMVGTSIGAIAGALFATGAETQAILNKVDYYFNCECFGKIKFDFLREAEEPVKNGNLFDGLSSFFRKRIFYNVHLANRQSFVDEKDYLENIRMLVDDVGLEDMEIPLGIVCTDINAGEESLLTQGSLVKAVAASCAVPGIFPPIEFNGQILMDGGWVSQLPAKSTRNLGADIVIAVDVGGELEKEYSLDTGLDIIRRTNAISRFALNALQAEDADLIISPAVDGMSWAEFTCIDECLKRGEEAAERAVPEIRKLIDERSSLSYRLLHS